MAGVAHTKKDETATWWRRRLELAREVWREVKKTHHRAELHRCGNLDMPGVVAGRDEDIGDAEGVEQVDVNYIARYVRWVESQTFDAHPEVKYPRYAAPDAKHGDMIGEVLTRIGDEADEMEPWRGTIADACFNGCFAVWYGIHRDITDSETLYDVMRGAGEVVASAAIGPHEAREGQDHQKIAEVARSQALGDGTPEGMLDAKLLQLGPDGDDIQERLLEAAALHDAAAAKEEEGPFDYEDASNRIWVRRCPVGVSTLWDPSADDMKDARWVARKIVLDLDVARKHPGFRPRVARQLRSGVIGDVDEFAREEQPTLDLDEEDEDRLTYRTSIWEIWDRKYRERHYVADGVDEFLEKDASNPYVDLDTGKPLIRDFFPCVIEAPVKPSQLSSKRPYGIPVAAPAWPLQRAAIQFFSHNLDAVKKLAVRVLLYDEGVDEDVLEAICAGETGKMVKTPGGVEGKRPADMVQPLNFGPVPREMFEQFQVAQRELATVLAWPMSQMVGQPQADTATAEKISVSAGHAQLGDFIRCLENAFAKGQEIKRALVKGFYSDEQISELVGEVHKKSWKEWKASSLKGDRLQARFQARINGEDPVRIKQAMDALALLRQERHPVYGVELYDTEHLINEIVRLLGLGHPVKREYDQAELQLIAMRTLSSIGSNGEKKPEREKKSGEANRREKPATEQQMGAGVQRVGPSEGPGRGMFPQ